MNRKPHPEALPLAGLLVIVLVIVAVALALNAVTAGASARPDPRGDCSPACVKRVKARQHRQHRLDVIRPYRPWLASVGDCESGTRDLRTGLTAISPNGRWRGRYQFGIPTWQAAGGKGDPIDASWLEQAYRAVRWRQKIGNPHQPAGWPVCG